MNEHDIRDTAIRNTHPLVVTVRGGDQAWDQAGTEVTLHEAAIAAEIARLQALPPAPDWDGFRLYCLGGIFAADYPMIAKLIDHYTSFIVGIQYHNPDLVNAALDNALADHTLDPTTGIPQVTVDAIHAAMVTYHVEGA